MPPPALTTEPTALENMFLLKLEILHHLREDEYREDEFDFDIAQNIYTVYAMRATPTPVNFAEDFGLADEELAELSERLGQLGIEGVDPEAFDLTILGKIDFEALIEALPVLM